MMNVGDVVYYRDEKCGCHRFYEVLSICLGGTGQEGLIELQCLNETPGHDVNGKLIETTWVPEPLLRNARVLKAWQEDEPDLCLKCEYKIHYEKIRELPSCNDCGIKKECGYKPNWGFFERINCPHWFESATEKGV